MEIRIAFLATGWIDATNDIYIGDYDELVRYVNRNRYIIANEDCLVKHDQFWYNESYYGKKIIKELSHRNLSVYVLDGGDYYDIHVVDPKFKDEELNTLFLQEPKSDVQENYFTNKRLIRYLAEHFLWEYFYNFHNTIYSFSVEVYDEND